LTTHLNCDIIYTMNSKEFSLKIESIVKEKRTTYMEAIIWYCEQNDLDVGLIKTMINKSLKEKIKGEAINLRMLKEKRGGVLPL
jgi:hypothetical protein